MTGDVNMDIDVKDEGNIDEHNQLMQPIAQKSGSG